MATFTTDVLTNFVVLTGRAGCRPFNVWRLVKTTMATWIRTACQVIVSDGTNSAIGNVLVRVASLSPGLAQVPIGVEDLLAGCRV